MKTLFIVIFFSFSIMGCHHNAPSETNLDYVKGLEYMINYHSLKGDNFNVEELTGKDLIFFTILYDYYDMPRGFISALYIESNKDSFDLYIDIELCGFDYTEEISSKSRISWIPFFIRNYRKVDRKEFEFMKDFLTKEMELLDPNDYAPEESLKKGFYSFLSIYNKDLTRYTYGKKEDYKDFLFDRYNIQPQFLPKYLVSP